MRALSLTFAAALLLAPLTAEATISRAMKFDEKVENAAAIVVGKCIRSWPRR